MVGREQEVLVEGLARMQTGQLCGRTGGNHMVNFPVPVSTDGTPHSAQDLIGTIARVRITEARINTLAGQLI
jgi:tRNA A37 methylthiotransferase MiaB